MKPEKSDARRKEITLLLAADNVDDESQMDVALHGELAGKIVEQIFEQASKECVVRNIKANVPFRKKQKKMFNVCSLHFSITKIINNN